MSTSNQKGQKAGPFSSEEIAYIQNNVHMLQVPEMAKVLKRNPKTLQKWITKHILEKKPHNLTREERERAAKSAIKVQLRTSLAWKKLADEFTEDELAYFEEEYTALMEQFKDDVYKTEEQQIRKAITLDILMRRNMASRKKILSEIDRVDMMLRREIREYEEERPELSKEERLSREGNIGRIRTELSSLQGAEQSKTREYSDLDGRHQKLMEALKATREQRILKVESNKQSVIGLIKELADEDRRAEAERLVKLVNKATEKEKKRLGSPHVYSGGQEDLPILNHQTLTDLDQKS